MKIQEKVISTMKSVALDSINKAGQGHIGMAIGAAPITYSLIGENLNFSSKNPKWINRDRFVMSAGHGSMAYYSIMHVLGLLTKKDMQDHKELHSKTPSHPEIDAYEYVDASTGPLGQGVAMAVGMSISQKYLSNRYNKPKYKLFDHKVFTLIGDGCLQEGVALEALQLAGTLKLNDFVVIQDYNGVQIDSRADEVNNIDTIAYFKSMNFNTIDVKTPSLENINKAISESKVSSKPTFIRIHTIIAKDTPVENKSNGHNGVLTPEDTIKFKEKIGLSNTTPFEYDNDVFEHGAKLLEKKNVEYDKYEKMFSDYSKDFPKEYKELNGLINNSNTYKFSDISFDEKDVATRNYFVPIMKRISDLYDIVGGSADLTAATKIGFDKTIVEGGKNIKYGIREHAMVAINNGIYLHSNIRTIDATFLSFADYAKPAYRLGSIQEIPSVHILTHDSYQVGGDGPTHQPFDQLTMIRAIHNSRVYRPADATEMKYTFEDAFNNKKDQSFIIACRQPIKSFNLDNEFKSGFVPAYKIKNIDTFDLTIIATGSEAELAYLASEELAKDNIKAQVISAPFLQGLLSDEKLINSLGINKKPILAVEASNDSIWYRLAKYNKFDAILSEGYGHSAPGPDVYDLKGFNVSNVVSRAKKLIKE